MHILKSRETVPNRADRLGTNPNRAVSTEDYSFAGRCRPRSVSKTDAVMLGRASDTHSKGPFSREIPNHRSLRGFPDRIVQFTWADRLSEVYTVLRRVYRSQSCRFPRTYRKTAAPASRRC